MKYIFDYYVIQADTLTDYLLDQMEKSNNIVKLQQDCHESMNDNDFINCSCYYFYSIQFEISARALTPIYSSYIRNGYSSLSCRNTSQIAY